MEKNIIIMGSPGSGKGTLAQQIADKYNLKHISTGDLLRERSKKDDELGKLIANLIEKGHFVSDELIRQIVIEEIQNNPKFILDGFPRTKSQMLMMNSFFENQNESERPIAIIIQAKQQTVLTRLKNRGLLENRKDDSSDSILKVRMTEFIKKTQPVISHFLKQSSSVVLDGEKTPEEVFNEFQEKIVSNEKII